MAARLLVVVYAGLVAWWNLAVPATARHDVAVLLAIQLDWPRWLVYAWLLVACAIPRSRADSLHLLATERSPAAPSRPVSARRGLRLGSWAQLRLVAEVACLFVLASGFTTLWVVLRGGVFHVEPVIVGVLLSLAATFQVSLLVSAFGESSFTAWSFGTLLAITEVWQGRIGATGMDLGLGLVLVWAGLGLVFVGFEPVLRKRTFDKASV